MQSDILPLSMGFKAKVIQTFFKNGILLFITGTFICYALLTNKRYYNVLQ